MHAYRTHTCGALRAADVGQTVRLSGWIHRKRDHGGLMFVDLRDHAAVRAAMRQNEAAVTAVRQAVTVGKEAAISALREDTRFDSLRSMPQFQKAVGGF